MTNIIMTIFVLGTAFMLIQVGIGLALFLFIEKRFSNRPKRTELSISDSKKLRDKYSQMQEEHKAAAEKVKAAMKRYKAS